MTYYVYMLRCQNGHYYTGSTNDLEKRLRAHNEGKGARYTRSFRPCVLVYFETFDQKTDALKREAALKKLTHREKEELIHET